MWHALMADMRHALLAGWAIYLGALVSCAVPVAIERSKTLPVAVAPADSPQARDALDRGKVEDAKPPETDWLGIIANVGGALLGAGGLGAASLLARRASKVRAAARIACDLADDLEAGLPDAKARAIERQEAAGVRDLTADIRGK